MANTNLSLGSDFDSNPCTLMELSVMQERLRQARLSFNLAFVLTATSSIISLVGVALLLSGKVPEGTVTTAGGLASKIVGVHCLKFAQDANNRLDQMAKDLNDQD